MPAPAPAPSGPPTTQAGVAALDFIPEAESPGNYMLPVLYPLSAPNSPVIGDYYRVSVFQDPRIYLYRWVDVKLKGTNTLVASGYTYVLGATDSHPNGGPGFPSSGNGSYDFSWGPSIRYLEYVYTWNNTFRIMIARK